MSTSAIINFKFGGKELPLHIRSDGYPSNVVLSLTQLKLLCDAGIIKWDDLRTFLEKYDGAMSLNWCHWNNEDELLTMANATVEDFICEFDDGYSDRDPDSWRDAYGSYIYDLGTKMKSLEETKHGEEYKMYNFTESEAREMLIRFFFQDKKAIHWVRKID